MNSFGMGVLGIIIGVGVGVGLLYVLTTYVTPLIVN